MNFGNIDELYVPVNGVVKEVAQINDHHGNRLWKRQLKVDHYLVGDGTGPSGSSSFDTSGMMSVGDFTVGGEYTVEFEVYIDSFSNGTGWILENQQGWRPIYAFGTLYYFYTGSSYKQYNPSSITLDQSKYRFTCYNYSDIKIENLTTGETWTGTTADSSWVAKTVTLYMNPVSGFKVYRVRNLDPNGNVIKDLTPTPSGMYDSVSETTYPLSHFNYGPIYHLDCNTNTGETVFYSGVPSNTNTTLEFVANTKSKGEVVWVNGNGDNTKMLRVGIVSAIGDAIYYFSGNSYTNGNPRTWTSDVYGLDDKIRTVLGPTDGNIYIDGESTPVWSGHVSSAAPVLGDISMRNSTNRKLWSVKATIGGVVILDAFVTADGLYDKVRRDIIPTPNCSVVREY